MTETASAWQTAARRAAAALRRSASAPSAGKETLHVLRDPRTLYLALVMPVVMLFLFGYGVSFDIDHVPVAVADLDRTEASRALVRTVTGSRELVSCGRGRRPATPSGSSAAGPGRGGAGRPPRTTARRWRAASGSTLQLLVDGSDVTVANQVLAKADALVRAETAAAGRRGASVAGRHPRCR